MLIFGGVGEVVNTLVCGNSIQGFDSLTPPHVEDRLTNLTIRKFLFYINNYQKKKNLYLNLILFKSFN